MATKDTTDALIGMTREDLIAVITAARGDDDEVLRKQAQFQAEAHQKLTKKENETHPGKSVYSNLGGDRDDPKPALRCKMVWVGYPLDVETITPEEVRLLNLARPGEFQFRKTDGSTVTMTITASLTADGRPERFEFFFPCRGDNRHNLPSMADTLRQIFHEPTEADRLRAENAALQQQLAAVSAEP